MKIKVIFATGVLAVLLNALVNAAESVPKYKPSARSPEPQDITNAAYGFSVNAPNALSVGDTVPDFTLPRSGGGAISLSAAHSRGPVVIVFYRGHW